MERGLTRRLVLEAKSGAPDGGGGFDTGWTEVAVHWAAMRATGASETFVGGGQAGAVKHVAEIRYRAPEDPTRPRADQRFREGDRIYAIRGVAEADERRDRLMIWLEEGATP